MIELSPIALFAYARPRHLQLALESLLANPEARDTRLYVFCDGPKKDEHKDAVEEVRRICRKIHGFKSVEIVERGENLGLAKSIIQGVSSVVGMHGRVIVLEDDLILSPKFLFFMNEGLRIYQNVDAVASIHGYCYPTDHVPSAPYFLKGADCWGWATWQRAWDFFEPDGSILLSKLNALDDASEFDFGVSGRYSNMLRDQIEGKNDSWAIRWYASAFFAKKYTLYPPQSYVANCGHDGSGSHCESSNLYDVAISHADVDCWPTIVADDTKMRMEISKYFAANSTRGILSRICEHISMIFKIRKNGNYAS